MSGEIQLNPDGELILDYSGRSLLSSPPIPCDCIRCGTPLDPDLCYLQVSASYCCFPVDSYCELSFGTLVLAPSSPSLIYYDVAVDLAANVSGIVLNVPHRKSGQSIFLKFGNVSQLDGDYAYAWYVSVVGNNLPPFPRIASDLCWSVQVGVARRYRGCSQIGDDFNTCIDSEVAFSVPATFFLVGSNTSPIWCGSCCGATTPNSPYISFPNYFSSVGDFNSLNVLTPCTVCDSNNDLPTTLTFDDAQVIQDCWSGTGIGITTLNRLTSGSFLEQEIYQYTGPFIIYNVYPIQVGKAVSLELRNCCWTLTFIIEYSDVSDPSKNKTCRKVYTKCTGLDTPIGTYTQVSGTETVDVA